MEEFRPDRGFHGDHGSQHGCCGIVGLHSGGDAAALQPDARKNFTRAYERRMESTVTHLLCLNPHRFGDES